MSDFPDAQTRYEQALEQLADHLRTGTPLPNTEIYWRRVVDIPKLRRRYRLTQQAFADRLGISIGTLRNWEQKRRVPDGPAQRLLELLEDRPDVAQRIFFHPDAEPGPEHSAAPRPGRRAAGGRR
jgi:putative transcriptional regulator